MRNSLLRDLLRFFVGLMKIGVIYIAILMCLLSYAVWVGAISTLLFFVILPISLPVFFLCCCGLVFFASFLGVVGWLGLQAAYYISTNLRAESVNAFLAARVRLWNRIKRIFLRQDVSFQFTIDKQIEYIQEVERKCPHEVTKLSVKEEEKLEKEVIPDEFRGPISYAIIKDPVYIENDGPKVTIDGESFPRHYEYSWLKTYQEQQGVSPLTREGFSEGNIKPASKEYVYKLNAWIKTSLQNN